MLLVSRLYQYSPSKFFAFLRTLLADDGFEPEISFEMQEKSPKSVPDACISQSSFKIVVETKLSGKSFCESQLVRHLESFGSEDYRVLVTLAPSEMPDAVLEDFERRLKSHNESSDYPVSHVNLTFSGLASALEELLDERDYEMSDILNDYFDYCVRDGLIVQSSSWRYLRMQLASGTFDFNVEHNVYFDRASRAFRPHDYLGLYKDKSLRAIGKICAQVTCMEKEGKLSYHVEKGELTEDRKRVIDEAIAEMRSRGHDLRPLEHRYFFVERFCETDFPKVSPRAPMGTRIFDLPDVLETDELPDIEGIAQALRTRTWS